MTKGSGNIDEPLGDSERAELERLRQRVAELETAGGSQPDGSGTSLSEGAPSRRRRINWRAIGVTVLVVLCAVLTLLSVTTRFVRSEILDTDHYVATVTPLASNPDVQAQVTESVVDEINSRIDLTQLTTEAMTAVSQAVPPERRQLESAIAGLAPVLASQAEGYIHSTVADFVGSPEFVNLWVAANRSAHTGVVAAVTGQTSHEAVSVDTTHGSVSIELGPIIEKVKERLTAQGFAAAASIPVVNKQFVIWQSEQLARAQGLVSTLDTVATALPWLALLALFAAIWLAGSGRRLRTLSITGVAIVLAMLLLAIGIVIGRAIYLREIPADVMSPASARAVFDTVIDPMRMALRAVAVLGLVFALVGFFAGGSKSAQAVRSAVGRWFGAVDGHRADRDASAVENALWRFRIPIRIAILVIAAVLLMFWSYPTGMVVVWIAVITCLVLIVFEFAIAPARRAVTSTSPVVPQ